MKQSADNNDADIRQASDQELSNWFMGYGLPKVIVDITIR